MINKLPTLVFLLFIIVTTAQTPISGGEVSGIWSKSNSPYIIGGDITIVNELLIQPGVQVLVNDHVRIDVLGKLLAEGSENDSIIFRNNETEWGGLYFKDNDEFSILKYFELTGVRNLQGYGGALSIDNSKNTLVSNGAIYGNSSEYRGGGIVLRNLENFTLANVLFYKNRLFSEGSGYSLREGIAIYIGDSSINLRNITVAKSSFSNSSTNTGTAIYWTSSEVTLSNCLIQNNDCLSLSRFNTSAPLNISYSNIEGLERLNGTSNLINGEGNFDESPDFVDFENDNYNLMWANPPDNKPKEIDGGSPFFHDKDGSKSDIGAFTYDQAGQYFPPSSWFESDSDRIQSGTEIQFINKSQKGSQNITSYFWDFGDGMNSNEINPTHTYNAYGKFDVSLTVKDDQGNSITKIFKQFIISGTVINEGDVSGLWVKNESPYIVKGNIIVPEGELLEINEGVEVLFSGYYGIGVVGDLMSTGIENEPVKFTALDTLYFWDRKKHFNSYTNETEYTGWKGILFKGNNTNSYLKYSDFSYVRRYTYDYNTEYGSAVWVNDNESFTIDHCQFINNNANGYNEGTSSGFIAAAIRGHNSNLIITKCQFRNNHADHNPVIHIFDTKKTTINDCVFENNFSQIKSSIISIVSANRTNDSDENNLNNNIIRNNNAGGILTGVNNLDDNPIKTFIKNNDIIGNNGEGIRCDWSTIVDGNKIVNNVGSYAGGGITAHGGIIINNFISGNTMDYYWSSGSAILCDTGNTYIINNTITDNFHPRGVAVYGDNATYTAINNIVYNNDGTFGQNTGAGVHPPAIIENNFESDPLFQENNAPMLSTESPCIDSGTLALPIDPSDRDFYGNARRYGIGGKIDIGAVEIDDTQPILAIINNATCIGKKNGRLEVKTKTFGIDYKATLVSENGHVERVFDDTVEFVELEVGSYQLCVTNLENQKIKCYDLLIKEPESLDVTSTISKGLSNKVSLKINGGVKPYSILLNGEKIAETSQSEIIISAFNGDLLEVSSKSDCELSYNEIINLNESLVIYPNPTNGLLKVLLNSNHLNTYDKILVHVTDLSGITIFSKKVKVNESAFEIDLSSLSSNIYLLTLELDTSITLKVIRQ